MKTYNRLIFPMLILSLFFLACTDTASGPVDPALVGSQITTGEIQIAAEYSMPDDVQSKTLQFMREEEKLARDVYSAMYSKYSLRVFQNISSSEQTHMNAIKLLLEKYQIEDPVSSDIAGKFKDSDLQKLYNDLITKGSVSSDEALKVGAAIEEIDILDLEKHILELSAENIDIKQVYTSLKNASINHLKAFVRNLTSKGVSYSPAYLSVEYYNSIIL